MISFETYPFEKLNELLKDVTPNTKYTFSNLTIGEPQFNTPKFIQDELKNTTNLLNKYPKSGGEEYLYNSMIGFVKNRFNITLKNTEIIPLFGTKEALFNFPQFYLFDKQNPTIAFSNPFYQIYEGSAIASRAKIIHLNLLEENNFLPIINDDVLKKCDIVILNYPNNPTGALMSKENMRKWAKKSLEFDFVLINDECYSELYSNNDDKPISLLEVCKDIGNENFKNAIVFNSISKRSSSPGLRSGFIAGDENILKGYKKYRTYSGCSLPLPFQKTASVAWSDEKHVKKFRINYKKNLTIAKNTLGIKVPNATFYIWLKVDNDISFCKKLYESKNIKVLPGRFLGRNNIGKGYVRIALVEDPETTIEVMLRLKDFINFN
jgi:aspartate/methionine/tyrosine aminotransferase